jgi:hypothetical protein
MMQDVHVKLNPGLPWQKHNNALVMAIEREWGYFYRQIGLKFKKETSEVLHLECNIIWCWQVDLRKVD